MLYLVLLVLFEVVVFDELLEVLVLEELFEVVVLEVLVLPLLAALAAGRLNAEANATTLTSTSALRIFMTSISQRFLNDG